MPIIAGYPWRDLVGPIIAKTTGAGKPTLTQMGSTGIYNFAFAVNDEVSIVYHIDHDYLPDSDLFLHAHWTTDGTATEAVAWTFTWSYAKGHDQDNFDIAAGGSTRTVSQAAAGTAWRHMVTEVSAAQALKDPTFETDGLLLLNVKRVTNGGSDNSDTVFLLTADAHYQVHCRHGTDNRAPPFA